MIDPGIGARYHGKTKRVINPDGSFNVVKSGANIHLLNTYDQLINMSWVKFLFYSLIAFFTINCVFAIVYMGLGVDQLQGTKSGGHLENFWQALFFSTQTFTTVGYGAIAPMSKTVSLVAAFEAMIGLMFFALVTGLLYGRFSRPMSKMRFSKNVLISPYQDINALMFRVANIRNNVLINLEAQVLLTLLEDNQGHFKRTYYRLNLERDNIQWFPLNWTIVHPINEKSPLWGLSPETLAQKHAELLILLKGFDDNYSQVVHTKYSYLFNDVKWGAKFKPAYHIGNEGDIIMDLSKMDDLESAPLNG